MAAILCAAPFRPAPGLVVWSMKPPDLALTGRPPLGLAASVSKAYSQADTHDEMAPLVFRGTSCYIQHPLMHIAWVMNMKLVFCVQACACCSKKGLSVFLCTCWETRAWTSAPKRACGGPFWNRYLLRFLLVYLFCRHPGLDARLHGKLLGQHWTLQLVLLSKSKFTKQLKHGQ